MENKHREIVRERDGATTLVLFIHGIMGSPRQFLPYIDRVCDQGYSAVALLLPGHDRGALAFSRTGLLHWEAYVRRQIRAYAARYERIVIVGHSMGGLLGLNESTEKKSHIAGVFLISPPIQINLAPWSIQARARLALSARQKEMWQRYTDLSSVSASSLPVYLLWSRPFGALLLLIRKTRRRMGEFTVPVYYVHSKRDESVSERSHDALERGLVNAEHEGMTLSDSWHTWFTDEDVEKIWAKMAGFLEKVAPLSRATAGGAG